jgi:steroid delta-isomerase-like uncharacterized protein
MVNNAKNSAGDPVAAINSRDIEKLLSFYTDDCVYEDIAIGKVNHGKEELKNFYTELFLMAPDVKIEDKILIKAGDWQATEWVMTGTNTGNTPEMPATGKSFSIRGSSIMQMRNGKVSRQTDYWNMASFLK